MNSETLTSTTTTTTLVALVAGALLFVLCASASSQDIVVLDDQIIEGKILEVTKEEVVLQNELGRKQKIGRHTVKGVLKGQTIESYLELMTGTLKEDDADGRAKLGEMAVKSGRADLAQELFLVALLIDPTNDKAGNGLGYREVGGKWEPRPENPLERKVGGVKVTGPSITYVYNEIIEGKDWREFPQVCPGYTWDEAVSMQLIGQLFNQDHAWGLFKDPVADADKAEFHVELDINNIKTKTTTWMSHKVQDFYKATIELRVTRRSDDARVLTVISTAERGNRLEGQAARNAMVTAARNLVADPRVKNHELWENPQAIRGSGARIVVEQESK